MYHLSHLRLKFLTNLRYHLFRSNLQNPKCHLNLQSLMFRLNP
jgi:hypothetical protein